MPLIFAKREVEAGSVRSSISTDMGRLQYTGKFLLSCVGACPTHHIETPRKCPAVTMSARNIVLPMSSACSLCSVVTNLHQVQSTGHRLALRMPTRPRGTTAGAV